MNPKKHVVSKFPLHLDIELNTDCNLACEFCPNHSKNARYPPKERIHMQWDLWKRIIDEGVEKGLCAIKLCFRGEPLLYKFLPEAVFYAKNQGIMEVILDSNGLLLERAVLIELMLGGLDQFILSDYGFELQVKKAKLIQSNKKLLHFDNPRLIVKTTTPEKWEGIADEVRKPILHDYNSGEECFEDSDFECEQLYQRLVVLANGDVKVCCSSVMFEDGIIGNIAEDSIEELWNGEYMKYIRFMHQNHRANMIKSCRYCPGLIEFVQDRCKRDFIDKNLLFPCNGFTTSVFWDKLTAKDMKEKYEDEDEDERCQK